MKYFPHKRNKLYLKRLIFYLLSSSRLSPKSQEKIFEIDLRLKVFFKKIVIFLPKCNYEEIYCNSMLNLYISDYPKYNLSKSSAF